MSIDEEILLVINKTSNIISKMKTNNIDDLKFEQDKISKEEVQKLLTAKLDLEGFIESLNSLLSETNKLLFQTNKETSIIILKNNLELINMNRKQFNKLLEKINLLLAQLKLNKNLSK